MKKVTIPTNEGIDWSKKQWVQSIAYPDLIVLANGEIVGDNFTGTAMPCNRYPRGEYRTDWCKSAFKHLTSDIPFTISNSNNED